MARTTKRSFKTKKQRRNNKRKTKRALRKTTGGKRYGQGTYGAVYGDPRIPCEDEDFNRDKIAGKPEVSKVIFDEKQLSKMELSMELIKSRFQNTDELEEYVILPSRICKVNHEQLKENSNIYTSKWREYDDISQYDVQIISRKGKQDLYSELSSVNTMKEFHNFLAGLSNILTGLRMLHEKDIMHGDIKMGNAISMGDGSFRIIDTDELRPFDDVKQIDREFFYNNFMYYIWPLAAIWTKDDNSKPSIATIHNTISSNIKSQFNRDNAEYFKTGFSSVYSKIKKTEPNFEETMLSEKDPNNNDVIKKISEKCETKTLYPYIDRYSFGIILMETLKKYFTLPNTSENDPLVAGMIAIIERCCFIKYGFTITTAEIDEMYMDFIAEVIEA